jgi:hypothetical protein
MVFGVTGILCYLKLHFYLSENQTFTSVVKYNPKISHPKIPSATYNNL